MVDSNFFDLRAVLLYWGPFAVSSSVFPFGVLCIGFAPLGAVICARMAKKKQLPVLKFAVAGALFSMFLLLPWFYLITRMKGKHFPLPLAVLAYITVYSVWLYGPLLMYFWYHVVMTIYIDDLSVEVSSTRIYMIAIGVALWIVSLVMLLTVHHHRSDADDASPDILPKQEYVMPFALLSGYTALIIPTMYNLWWLVVPASLSALAWLMYLLFKWLYVIIRGRFTRQQLTDA